MQWWRDQLCRCAGKVPDWCSGSLLRGLRGPRGASSFVCADAKEFLQGVHDQGVRFLHVVQGVTITLCGAGPVFRPWGGGGVGGRGGGKVLQESSRLLQ